MPEKTRRVPRLLSWRRDVGAVSDQLRAMGAGRMHHQKKIGSTPMWHGLEMWQVYVLA